MEELEILCIQMMRKQQFDALAVGVLDFKNLKHKSFEITDKKYLSKKPFLWFDLASMTKPLTLASTYLMHPDIFDDKMKLLLNHRGGLPAWGRLTGRLSKNNWKEQILGYKIQESETLYSDYSAIRLMLEIEKKTGKPLKHICSVFWDNELKNWKNLPQDSISPVTGIRRSHKIRGVVHDDNAFIIKEFCSHAGMFGTINGVCKSFLNLEKEFQLLSFMNEHYKNIGTHHYIAGWDRIIDSKETLAGIGAGPKTFGHLGFTGTSIWIDLEKKLGHVILTNATRDNWYDRNGVNELRKKIGKTIWKLQ